MVIIVKNLRKPGAELDNTKLIKLANMANQAIRQETNGQYGVVPKSVINRKMVLLVKVRNPETGKILDAPKGAQNNVADRMGQFLESQGVLADIDVK